jgi:hypothetical protein
MQQLGVPPPTGQPGFAAAVMKHHGINMDLCDSHVVSQNWKTKSIKQWQ